jgi:hypothetical protein
MNPYKKHGRKPPPTSYETPDGDKKQKAKKKRNDKANNDKRTMMVKVKQEPPSSEPCKQNETHTYVVRTEMIERSVKLNTMVEVIEIIDDDIMTPPTNKDACQQLYNYPITTFPLLLTQEKENEHPNKEEEEKKGEDEEEEQGKNNKRQKIARDLNNVFLEVSDEDNNANSENKSATDNGDNNNNTTTGTTTGDGTSITASANGSDENSSRARWNRYMKARQLSWLTGKPKTLTRKDIFIPPKQTTETTIKNNDGVTIATDGGTRAAEEAAVAVTEEAPTLQATVTHTRLWLKTVLLASCYGTTSTTSFATTASAIAATMESTSVDSTACTFTLMRKRWMLQNVPL